MSFLKGFKSRRIKYEKLKKVRCHISCWNDALAVRHSGENLWLPILCGLEGQHSGHISTAVAVIRCRPHRHKALVEHVLISLLHQLMSAADETQVVYVQELFSKRVM